jgi:hypothetical protein
MSILMFLCCTSNIKLWKMTRGGHTHDMNKKLKRGLKNVLYYFAGRRLNTTKIFILSDQ